MKVQPSVKRVCRNCKVIRRWQRIVIVAKAHGLARLQSIEGAENGRMAKALGDTAGVKRVEGLGRGVITDVDGLHDGSL